MINYHFVFKLHTKANHHLFGGWGEKEEEVGVRGGEKNNETSFQAFCESSTIKSSPWHGGVWGLSPTLQGSALRAAPTVGTQEATLLLPACCRDVVEALK